MNNSSQKPKSNHYYFDENANDYTFRRRSSKPTVANQSEKGVDASSAPY